MSRPLIETNLTYFSILERRVEYLGVIMDPTCSSSFEVGLSIFL